MEFSCFCFPPCLHYLLLNSYLTIPPCCCHSLPTTSSPSLSWLLALILMLILNCTLLHDFSFVTLDDSMVINEIRRVRFCQVNEPGHELQKGTHDEGSEEMQEQCRWCIWGGIRKHTKKIFIAMSFCWKKKKKKIVVTIMLIITTVF